VDLSAARHFAAGVHDSGEFEDGSALLRRCFLETLLRTAMMRWLAR
jgi:hypothetical protein